MIWATNFSNLDEVGVIFLVMQISLGRISGRGNPLPQNDWRLKVWRILRKKQPKLMLVNFKLLVLRMFVFHSLNLQLAKNWVGDRRDRDNAEGWIADFWPGFHSR